ncbi:hypothetical protein PMZ80_010025 [Knufia obscura]|uniref:Uncharacterized protein n=1 Tax=Knufia obscura TaxID=1635080 RepID=A0ABR0RBG8_9EURO|nr:hypothetical protein PMZ80_010025 [Knufia obscura]
MVTTRAMAAFQRQYGSPTIFDKLPTELRLMVWNHLFSCLRLQITKCTNGKSYLIGERGGLLGRYYLHPLLYVLKRYKAELAEAFYRSVLIEPLRIRYHDFGGRCDIGPLLLRQKVRRLELTIDELHLFVGPIWGTKPRTGKNVQVEGFPLITHLHLHWSLVVRRWIRSPRERWDRRWLGRLLACRKSFSVTVDIDATWEGGQIPVFHGKIVDGRLNVPFEYDHQGLIWWWEDRLRRDLMVEKEESVVEAQKFWIV